MSKTIDVRFCVPDDVTVASFISMVGLAVDAVQEAVPLVNDGFGDLRPAETMRQRFGPAGLPFTATAS